MLFEVVITRMKAQGNSIAYFAIEKICRYLDWFIYALVILHFFRDKNKMVLVVNMACGGRVRPIRFGRIGVPRRGNVYGLF